MGQYQSSLFECHRSEALSPRSIPNETGQSNKVIYLSMSSDTYDCSRDSYDFPHEVSSGLTSEYLEPDEREIFEHSTVIRDTNEIRDEINSCSSSRSCKSEADHIPPLAYSSESDTINSLLDDGNFDRKSIEDKESPRYECSDVNAESEAVSMSRCDVNYNTYLLQQDPFSDDFKNKGIVSTEVIIMQSPALLHDEDDGSKIGIGFEQPTAEVLNGIHVDEAPLLDYDSLQEFHVALDVENHNDRERMYIESACLCLHTDDKFEKETFDIADGEDQICDIIDDIQISETESVELPNSFLVESNMVNNTLDSCFIKEKDLTSNDDYVLGTAKNEDILNDKNCYDADGLENSSTVSRFHSMNDFVTQLVTESNSQIVIDNVQSSKHEQDLIFPSFVQEHPFEDQDAKSSTSKTHGCAELAIATECNESLEEPSQVVIVSEEVNDILEDSKYEFFVDGSESLDCDSLCDDVIVVKTHKNNITQYDEIAFEEQISSAENYWRHTYSSDENKGGVENDYVEINSLEERGALLTKADFVATVDDDEENEAADQRSDQSYENGATTTNIYDKEILCDLIKSCDDRSMHISDINADIYLDEEAVSSYPNVIEDYIKYVNADNTRRSPVDERTPSIFVVVVENDHRSEDLLDTSVNCSDICTRDDDHDLNLVATPAMISKILEDVKHVETVDGIQKPDYTTSPSLVVLVIEEETVCNGVKNELASLALNTDMVNFSGDEKDNITPCAHVDGYVDYLNTGKNTLDVQVSNDMTVQQENDFGCRNLNEDAYEHDKFNSALIHSDETFLCDNDKTIIEFENERVLCLDKGPTSEECGKISSESSCGLNKLILSADNSSTAIDRFVVEKSEEETPATVQNETFTDMNGEFDFVNIETAYSNNMTSSVSMSEGEDKSSGSSETGSTEVRTVPPVDRYDVYYDTVMKMTTNEKTLNSIENLPCDEIQSADGYPSSLSDATTLTTSNHDNSVMSVKSVPFGNICCSPVAFRAPMKHAAAPCSPARDMKQNVRVVPMSPSMSSFPNHMKVSNPGSCFSLSPSMNSLSSSNSATTSWSGPSKDKYDGNIPMSRPITPRKSGSSPKASQVVKTHVLECSEKFQPRIFQQSDGCERCIFLLSQQELATYRQKGNSPLVTVTSGGCHENCKFFHGMTGRGGVRLCMRCFQSLHKPSSDVKVKDAGICYRSRSGSASRSSMSSSSTMSAQSPVRSSSRGRYTF